MEGETTGRKMTLMVFLMLSEQSWNQMSMLKDVQSMLYFYNGSRNIARELYRNFKETVDIDILVTSRNGYRKIMQSIRITSRPPSRIRKWNQLSQFR